MTKEREMPERRKAFEKHFSNLDLSSICGKAYTSKITNRTWRGFEAAWNMRDVNPDASRPLPASDNAGEMEQSIPVAWGVFNGKTLLNPWRKFEHAQEDLKEWKINGKDKAEIRMLYSAATIHHTYDTPPPATPDGVDRLLKQIDYSVDLQRIIEAICAGRKIPKPQTGALYHYDIAVSFQEQYAHLSALQSPLPDLAGLKLDRYNRTPLTLEQSIDNAYTDIHNAAIDACIAAIANADKGAR